MNLNAKQIISIVGAVLSALMIAGSQLTDVFGAGVAKSIVSVAGLGNLILQSIMAGITSQGSTVRDVRSMKGVENIEVNAEANSTLAAIAVDPNEKKVSVRPKDLQQVAETAKGT